MFYKLIQFQCRQAPYDASIHPEVFMDDEVPEIFDHTPGIGGDLLFQEIDQIADRFADYDYDIFSYRSAVGFSIADEFLEIHPLRKFPDGSGRLQYVRNVELLGIFDFVLDTLFYHRFEGTLDPQIDFSMQ